MDGDNFMKNLSMRAKTIAVSATLAISTRAKKLKAEGHSVISFGVGEPDFDTPKNIKEAATKAINEGFTKYTPTSGTQELKSAICEKLKRDNNLDYELKNIVVSNGAKQSIFNALYAILNPGDDVLLLTPYWVSYPEMIKMCDGNTICVKPSNDLKVTIEDLEKYITPSSKAIILNTPCNPTGCVYTKEEIKEIAKFVLKHDLYVISDEIYEKLIYDPEIEHFSIASLSEEMKARTILVNGVSKSYSMTGFRIGYTAAPVEISKIMTNVQSHMTSNPNSIAQKAAYEAISGKQDSVDMMKKEFKKRRDYMVDRINNIQGLSCEKPKGAFYVMVDMREIYIKNYNGKAIDGNLFAELLLEQEKVAVVPGDSFGAPSYIRLSYALSLEDIKKGLDRIENFIKKLGTK